MALPAILLAGHSHSFPQPIVRFLGEHRVYGDGHLGYPPSQHSLPNPAASVYGVVIEVAGHRNQPAWLGENSHPLAGREVERSALVIRLQIEADARGRRGDAFANFFVPLILLRHKSIKLTPSGPNVVAGFFTLYFVFRIFRIEGLVVSCRYFRIPLFLELPRGLQFIERI